MLQKSFPIFLLAGLIFFFAGCSDFANPVGVEEQSQPKGLNFLTLPDPGAFFKAMETSTTISPQTGGELKLEYSQGQGSDKVDINITLRFDPGSVSEEIEVSMSVDQDILLTNIDITFGPSGSEFLKPAKLSVNTKGLDLSDIPSDAEIRLYYDNNGTWEEIEANMVRHNVDLGQLQCTNGKIPHFSRYAFAF